jgi:glycosyltransferase involved in cell wall biosynthesis
MTSEIIHSDTTPPREIPLGVRRRRPRVVHIVPALFGPDGGILGGAERYALELARHMAEKVPTTLVSFGDVARREKIGQLQVEIVGHPWYVHGQRSNPMAWALFSRLRNADVVHCHQQHVLASSLAAIFGRLRRKRVVVTDHGGGGWDFSSYIHTDSWYFKHLHVSQYSRNILGQSESPRASVILGGVDTTKFSPDDGVPRTGTVVFVGRLLPHKGVDDLLNAVTPVMDVEVVGAPCDARFVKDLNLLATGKRVRFRYECSDTELVEVYRRALCVVLPSVYHDKYEGHTSVPELLGQTLLEGMACGVPAISTDVGGMPEVVMDGVTGFIVPPNSPARLRERLTFLHQNAEQARQMGRAARKHIVEKFTWPLVVERCLQAYGT